MSRHKFVKGMNLDAELETFDGEGEYDDDGDVAGDEDLSPEDKELGGYQEQMQDGTAKVRSVLGSEVLCTDKEIQDALWHYYYDVEKTVTYLLNQKSMSETKVGKKGGKGVGKMTKGAHSIGIHASFSERCSTSFTAADFFKDVPWFNVPLHRLTEITIEPLYPRGGLLGGSPAEAGPKVSKLAALAAARKRKENEKGTDVTSKPQPTNSVALLDKLSGSQKTSEESTNYSRQPTNETSTASPRNEKPKFTTQTRKYPPGRRKSTSPRPVVQGITEQPTVLIEDSHNPTPIVASPSRFARTMLGPSIFQQEPRRRLSESLTTMFGPIYASGVNAELSPFVGPSPDDIVANAQNSKGSKGTKISNKPKPNEKAVNGISSGMSKVAIDDAPMAKSKNLDVTAEYVKSRRKNAANFVVIGHVDAGKSTLMGRLLYDLKVVDQRTIDRYQKEAQSIGKSSFALAWVLDQGTEERNRGVTIDIAMNKFETEKTKFTILDAPGHRDFIPNMIAGASQADFAVLVIDAGTGSFESGLKGQTKEHALLVRSMGVQRMIVLINKLDTVNWNRDRFEEIVQQVSAFLTVAGFQAKNVSFIPCSGLTGDNITRRSTNAQASWYTGPILLEELETSEPITRAIEKPLRLTIGDIFRSGVQNPLSISGRIDSGGVQIGDKVLAMPSGESAFVKGIEVDQESSEWAVAGQNVTLHLTDIDAIHLKSGDVVCPPSAPIDNITTFTTKILAFEHITPMHVEIHRGRLHAAGKITRLVGTLDKGSGAVIKKKPKLVQPGNVARIVVEMETAVPLEAPGRVVLRAGGETVAAGLLE